MKRVLFWIIELVSGALLGALVYQAVALYITGQSTFVYETAKLVGYALGVAIGVYATGRLFGKSGSLMYAFLGALIGGFVTRLVSAQVTVEGIVQLVRSAVLSAAVIGPILATIGYNIAHQRSQID